MWFMFFYLLNFLNLDNILASTHNTDCSMGLPISFQEVNNQEFKNVLDLFTSSTTTVAWPIIFSSIDLEDYQQLAEEIREEIQRQGIKYITVKENGKFVDICLTRMKDLSRDLLEQPINITFQLYTRLNPKRPKYLVQGRSEALNSSNLDITKPVKVFIHDWKSGYANEVGKSITKAYLSADDVNCIVVDWSDLAKAPYPLVVSQTKRIACVIGSFLNFIIRFGVNPKNIHVIGYSLGAHIAGFAGEKVPQKLGRITGLDPILPGFSCERMKKFGGYGRLNCNHADFVDVIHTNGGMISVMENIGHADFYPNGGRKQPGCGRVMFAACSHARAWLYFVESISTSTFSAKPCFVKGNKCNRKSVAMGELTPNTARGKFCLATASKAPFALTQTDCSQNVHC